MGKKKESEVGRGGVGGVCGARDDGGGGDVVVG